MNYGHFNTFKDFYKSIGKFYCPYFKEYIAFNAEGLVHLKFKSRRKARLDKDRNTRLKIFPTTIKIIGQSHTIQGITKKNRFEKRVVNSRVEAALLPVTYYEFLAIIEGVRAKVILKQIENGEKSFLSVIPVYKQKIPPDHGGMF